MKIDKSTFVFDLDNTLYNSKIRLFEQVDKKMGEFLSQEFSINMNDARKLQKTYFQKYGTTLRGLMINDNIEPKRFLNFVHDIDFSLINKDEELYKYLDRLDRRKIIYTNADLPYAMKVLQKLDIDGQFDGVFDIIDADYLPKPMAENYEKFINKYDIDDKDAIMFEDIARNLKIPSERGMVSVLIQSQDGHHDEYVRKWEGEENHSHIDYQFSDIKDFFR